MTQITRINPSERLDATLCMEPMAELAYRRICDLISTTNGRGIHDIAMGARTKTGKDWPYIRAQLIHEYNAISIENGYITLTPKWDLNTHKKEQKT